MEDNLGSLLADVSRLMRRSFDGRAKGIGLTRPQWQVLTVLRRNEGCNQGQLAELVDVEPITICRMLDRLQEAQLVERRPDPADRRSWRLHLKPKARKLLDQLVPMAFEMFEQAMEGIDEAERNALMASLARIRGNLQRPTPASRQASG